MLQAVLIILSCLGLLFWNYGNYAAIVVSWCQPLDIKKGKPIRKPKLSFNDTICCYIPALQACMVRKALYGRFGWTWPVGLLSSILIGLRLVNAFLLPINSYVLFATTIMMWIGLLMHAILYSVVTFQCARMYEFNTLYCISVLLLPHLLCCNMQTTIADKMRYMHKEATFDEHLGDTVIKSRHR